MGPDLLLIAHLYRVEKQARLLAAEDRLRLRQLQARPILEKLHQYLLEIQVEVLPKSPEGRVVRYALKNWTALNRYSEDGNLEIDNTGTQRSIRGVAVGRGNWMFFGSDVSGRTAAVLPSLVASCQGVNVDPFAWFKDILARIPSYSINRIAELLPHNLDLRSGLAPGLDSKQLTPPPHGDSQGFSAAYEQATWNILLSRQV
jgi:hypothetical protein